MKKIKPIIILGLLVMILLTIVTAVYASGGANFSLQTVSADPERKPEPYFIFEQTAGGIIHGEVQVKNTSLEAGTVRLYAVDAATGDTGGVVYGLSDDPKTTVSTWVQLSVEELTMESGESQVIPFSVSVPNDTRSGQHVGAIVAEAVASQAQKSIEATQNQAAFHVEVVGRSAIAVQVDVPGEVVNQIDVNGIEIGGQNSIQTMMLNLHNSGTEIEKPVGRLIVTDEFGDQVQGVRFRMDSFLPDTSISYPIPVEFQALDAGDYHVMLTMQYGSENRVHEHNLSFAVTEIENTQIFESRKALESPVELGNADASSALSMPFVIVLTALIVLCAGFIIFWIPQNKKAFKKKSKKKPLQVQITNKPVQ